MNKLSILVCDDSETVRKQMIETLKLIGIKKIYEAPDGDEAFNLCEKEHPNLVFMDIIMPKKDGIATLKQIHRQFPEIKIVLASSTTGRAHLKNTKLLGAYSFIQKPADEYKLKDIIEKYLEDNIKSTKKHANDI